MGKKKVLAWVACGALALAAAAWLSPRLSSEAQNATLERPASAASAPSEPAKSPSASLPVREAIGTPRGRLFDVESPPRRPAPVVAVEAPAPAAPPVPYRVAGQVIRDGVAQVLLARGEALFTASEGDTLENQYRIESIRADKITLVYLPLDERQELSVVSALAATPPPAPAQQAVRGTALSSERAQLRWQGPERVRAGDRFEVTLKVTSAEALRAAPLQLTYDASVLEAVHVRAGRFFAEGSFSYRINPSGSIFVGASGKGAIASDAELFVVSFKPIKPAAAAELRLSALMLQGAAGKPIVHEQPAAFRTTIVQ